MEAEQSNYYNTNNRELDVEMDYQPALDNNQVS